MWMRGRLCSDDFTRDELWVEHTILLVRERDLAVLMLTFPCSSQHLLLLCFALLCFCFALLCFASQAFYLATSVTLLSFFVALRNQQPFKFRDVKAVSILTATLVTLFILSVMQIGRAHV